MEPVKWFGYLWIGHYKKNVLKFSTDCNKLRQLSPEGMKIAIKNLNNGLKRHIHELKTNVHTSIEITRNSIDETCDLKPNLANHNASINATERTT
jgi:hypothetical protein